ncbi:hypothetical protein [Sphingobium yanoikuyae]|uniref:hypothetical protein n=1 Tax=Sphingobium yanoikuyae TaxID=13690 RepID=UPI002897E2AC|nr:hypothetical protein [Sphingobium yanoikuyae]
MATLGALLPSRLRPLQASEWRLCWVSFSEAEIRESPILSQKLTGNPARAIQIKMASNDHRKLEAILPLETSFHGRVAYSSVEISKNLVDPPI